VRFEVLGPVTVRRSSGERVRVPDRKVRALLADLLVTPGRVVSSDRLIDDLWGDELPANPTSTLQTRVSQLRRALAAAEPAGRSLVVTRAPGYLIDIAPEDLDIERFRALAARARRRTETRIRASLLADALGLWRGPAFADVAEESFARAVADRVEEERLVVVEEHAEARLELGEHHELSAALGELVARHPLRERLRAAQMRALYRSGRHSDGLAAFADLRTRLADELGIDPSPELHALYLAMLNQEPALAAPPVPVAHARTNLPVALTDLVGRQEAIAALTDRLRQSRLITLTGPGGVGKTCLAIKIAHRLAGGCPDGAWLVELAALPARAPAEELTALFAATLELPLGDRRPLVVLDNCEHVIGAAATVADRLLRAAPGLRILATSREPLGIFGEQVWPVPPLELPETGADVESAARSSAVQLFVARAGEADPGFHFTAANAGDVVEICRRLDGLPLALELAATRVRALGVRDLAERLDDRFRVLATPQRAAPNRQQTLRAMIEWSWELLTEPERAVLRRLSMHADACTLRAAEAVCAGGEVAGFDVADVLARLVDRSLVARLDTTAGSRYRLLESVRAYCLDRLREAGEHEQTRDRYVQYYDALAQHSEPRLYGHGDLFGYLGGLYRNAPQSGLNPNRPAAVESVVSADGTRIAFQRWGDGPAVILVGGALNDRLTLAPLAERLGQRFTAVSYDRRGRRGSGDTPPYAVEREIEDLGALVALADGPVFALGVSSGAVLAAEAAAQGVQLAGLALVEPPFILAGTRKPMPPDLDVQLNELVAAGRRGDAVEHFLTVAVEMTPEVLAPMRSAPLWPDLEALAHTISYELAVMGDFSLPYHWSQRVTRPTLVIDGGVSLAWRRHAAQAVTDLLPDARRLTMDGHPHDADPEILGPIVESFFLGAAQVGPR
jgi:predicted ATPase/DNA-binding SARP family transcriptional activator